MILVDVNLLVYARMSALPQHEAARTWLVEQLNSSHRIGLPWASLLGFVRVTATPRAFEHPQTIPAGWAQVEEWLDQPNVWIPEAGPDHRRILGDLLANLGGGHRLISDAHLAALAIEHGLTLCSTDGDFARFTKRGLKWVNPIE